MPHQFIKKRRLGQRLVGPRNDRRSRLPQDQPHQEFQQLATEQNLDPLIQDLPAAGSVGPLNRTPSVSAVSVPSWMTMNSPRPTTAPTPNSVSTANPATPTSSLTRTAGINLGVADHSATFSKDVPPCSDSLPCATMTSKTVPPSSLASAIASSASPSGANAFFASLGSSPGGIFVTTLVGLAILGVIFAISSWGLRRWCNRRRRKMIDDDTWGFLNTPKEFAKGPSDDDGTSVKSLGLGFPGALPHVLLHNDVPAHSASPKPFPTHDPNASVPFLPVLAFHHPQQPRTSCLINEGQMSWMSNPAGGPTRSSLCSGVVLAPMGASNTDFLAAPTPPEPAYGGSRADIPQFQGSCAGLADASSPLRGFTGPRPRSAAYIPPVKSDEKTPLTALPRSLTTRVRRHPLAREVSVARSDVSSTVEILRARVEDQKTDIRSKLIGAIQLAKAEEQCWSQSDVTSAPPDDPACTPYAPVDRVQPATPRPLQVEKCLPLLRHQLKDEQPPPSPQLARQTSQDSCYSVSTTVLGLNKNCSLEN